MYIKSISDAEKIGCMHGCIGALRRRRAHGDGVEQSWQRMVRAEDAGDGRVEGVRLSLSLLGEIRSRAGNSLKGCRLTVRKVGRHLAGFG